MSTAAFDPRMGASGDMLLGALLDAGAKETVLSPVADALELEIHVESVTRHGIAASDVSVAGAAEDVHRTFEDILTLVEGMDLPTGVEADAVAAFRLLGEAEATVHDTALADTHFHEVGADDAIADVVGTFLLLADLGVEHVVTAPCAAGGGDVEMSHGHYPVPTPAVTEIAARSELAIRGGPVSAELLTPTGAAILASAARHLQTLPAMTVGAVGYGVGDRRFDACPNVLRVLLGEQQGELVDEPLAVLETNVDDASPEVLGHLQETLADAGARDVSIVPLTMKKSRPGHQIRVVASPADEQRLARRLAEETGSLGIRAMPSVHRWVLERQVRDVDLTIQGTTYEVGVKIARDRSGEVIDISAEYEDVAGIAERVDRPVRDVMRRAEEATREAFAGTEDG